MAALKRRVGRRRLLPRSGRLTAHDTGDGTSPDGDADAGADTPAGLPGSLRATAGTAAAATTSPSRTGVADEDTDTGDRFSMPSPGHRPENRRQQWIKLLWVSLWMIYLSAPVSDLVGGGHGVPATVLGWLGLAGYLAGYFLLVFRHTGRIAPRTVYAELLAMLLLACGLSFALGPAWLVLFVYFSVTAGAVLPSPQSRWLICIGGVVLVGMGLSGWRSGDDANDLWPQLVIPALLGGFAMTGLRQMVRTTRELREARAAVAHLAASEERLRLARDLHDLLGHSLSLITLKSELAGKMLPAQPEAAAAQVADIEQVGRQALVDVREAVSDYRRPTLKVELAGARTTLAAAGIRADLPQHIPAPSTGDPVDPEQESALAWALREATTNVVRHSGATRCTVTLATQADDTFCLTVTDNGRGPSEPALHTTGTADTSGAEDGGTTSRTSTTSTDRTSSSSAVGSGNGLAGLAERLALADGSLETGAGMRGGFRLRATVPASPRADGAYGECSAPEDATDDAGAFRTEGRQR